MQRIGLNDVLPRVFSEQAGLQSEIWNRQTVFERGKKYLISAESGGGKSSLCAYLFGYRSDYLGEISFDGIPLRQLNTAQWCEIRRRQIAYLPQDLRLFPELTAMENVELKNRLTNHKTAQEIRQMFDRLRIGEKTGIPVAKLSIGQQQRVAIIRACCQPCDFFLLDEPVSHLDTANNQTIARMIEEEARRTEAGIIITSVGNNLEIDIDRTIRL